MSYRTPLARARGRGSAKEGVAHWWAQRLTAIALIPLSLWLAGSLLALVGADHATVTAWIGRPFNAVALLLLIVATFHHAQLGVQVVIEDYIHHEGWKTAWIVGVKFAAIVLGALAGFSVLKIAFGG